MKMVKSLLLGSAAGLAAVAGAQAADLPVKAKAVEYVKVCSLYGVGYYYIPGTDTCIKIGGYVRWEAYHNNTGGGTGAAYWNQGGGYALTRNASTFGQHARFRITMDTRTQTEYGTLRSYFAGGPNAQNNAYEVATSPSANTFSIERAFIQFAGFTIGRSDSMFGFYNGPAYNFVNFAMDGGAGPAGKNIFAYTWQFGNGLSASLSAEDQAAVSRPVVDLNTASNLLGTAFGGTAGGTVGDNYGQQMPDIVGNLRVDQAWGSAQIMGALHQVGGRYYTSFPANNCTGGGLVGTGAQNGTACGNPGNEWGWAVGAGLTLKMPWDAKDTFSGQVAYADGAIGYLGSAMFTNWLQKSGGIAVGPVTDGVFAQPNSLVAGYDGSLQTTKGWSFTAAFEHYWTPSLRTSIVGGMYSIQYNDTAKALIAANGCAQAGAALGQIAVGVNNTCNPDFTTWRLASRTMWNPVANLDVGLEIAYTKVNTAFAGTAFVTGTAGAASAAASSGVSTGTYNIQDQDIWSATMRVQRNFWP